MTGISPEVVSDSGVARGRHPRGLDLWRSPRVDDRGSSPDRRRAWAREVRSSRSVEGDHPPDVGWDAVRPG
ncbi:hypothetical protein ElP_65400 [Tautonia plasticadhaerens]|uniref:Uncharacterized protein n=1 Tax=Tautonia plasticadhaerens TaxID=2527974 RepID=A0A518HCJ5_9BACT|nr:hypothetical protein ElP_65400 [Tautonia plasticadhaerens]